MPKDGKKKKKQKKNRTLGRIQRDKDFLARRKKKKTIKSKTRGHKKPLVNNRQHESADSEMGGNTWWKNKGKLKTYWKIKEWVFQRTDEVCLPLTCEEISQRVIYLQEHHTLPNTHRHTQVHMPMQIAFCICFQCSLLTLWRILQKSLSSSAAIQGDLFLPHRV